jgi:hypothetical protein
MSGFCIQYRFKRLPKWRCAKLETHRQINWNHLLRMFSNRLFRVFRLMREEVTEGGENYTVKGS